VQPLAIVNVTLHQFEDGPPILSGHEFIPGETVFFSLQVQRYQVAPDRKVRSNYRIEAADSDETPLAEMQAGKVVTDLSDMDKDWLPRIRHSVLIPAHALPGKFRIGVRVKDENSGREAQADVSFLVQGRHVETGGVLTLRNFRFLRGEEDREPLAAAAYRPGDTLWARFDITGFKAGEKNRIRVVYGISVVSPSGKVLLSEPQAAIDEEAPFYPKRYVPGIASLNVQPKTAPGEYTFVVTARDEVGQQTSEGRFAFRVE
jgi:hypothetical protein